MGQFLRVGDPDLLGHRAIGLHVLAADDEVRGEDGFARQVRPLKVWADAGPRLDTRGGGTMHSTTL